jgi:hypothetical protein
MNKEETGAFSHFKGKDALKHMVEVQAEGLLASSEIHGAETPGSYFAAFDAARETSIVLLLVVAALSFLSFSTDQMYAILGSFSLGWLFWKIGRSSWLAWSRLERLHRLAAQEQQEIQENRSQEREELKALYRAKGFQGQLLDDVIDVLMADSDRLLRVMLQEEMGFRLEENEHPLVQGLGAGIGVLFAVLVVISSFVLYDNMGALMGALCTLSIAAAFAAYRERNHVISAIVWNLGMALLAYVAVDQIMEYFCQ